MVDAGDGRGDEEREDEEALAAALLLSMEPQQRAVEPPPTAAAAAAAAGARAGVDASSGDVDDGFEQWLVEMERRALQQAEPAPMPCMLSPSPSPTAPLTTAGGSVDGDVRIDAQPRGSEREAAMDPPELASGEVGDEDEAAALAEAVAMSLGLNAPAEAVAMSRPLASLSPEEEFTLSLTRPPSLGLGLEVDQVDGTGLLIKSVHPGVAQEWNETHPDSALEQGDCIVEVNGLRGDAEKLIQQCRDKVDLILTIVRRAPHRQQGKRHTEASGASTHKVDDAVVEEHMELPQQPVINSTAPHSTAVGKDEGAAGQPIHTAGLEQEKVNTNECSGAASEEVAPEKIEAAGRQLICNAACLDAVGISSSLLEGAHVDYRDLDGNTALLALAGGSITGNCIEPFLELLKAGADLNAQNLLGETALQMAARQNNSVLVERLLQSRANVNVQDNFGETALTEAVVAEEIGLVKLLLHARALVAPVASSLPHGLLAVDTTSASPTGGGADADGGGELGALLRREARAQLLEASKVQDKETFRSADLPNFAPPSSGVETERESAKREQAVILREHQVDRELYDVRHPKGSHGLRAQRAANDIARRAEYSSGARSGIMGFGAAPPSEEAQPTGESGTWAWKKQNKQREQSVFQGLGTELGAGTARNRGSKEEEESPWTARTGLKAPWDGVPGVLAGKADSSSGLVMIAYDYMRDGEAAAVHAKEIAAVLGTASFRFEVPSEVAVPSEVVPTWEMGDPSLSAQILLCMVQDFARRSALLRVRALVGVGFAACHVLECAARFGAQVPSSTALVVGPQHTSWPSKLEWPPLSEVLLICGDAPGARTPLEALAAELPKGSEVSVSIVSCESPAAAASAGGQRRLNGVASGKDTQDSGWRSEVEKVEAQRAKEQHRTIATASALNRCSKEHEVNEDIAMVMSFIAQEEAMASQKAKEEERCQSEQQHVGEKQSVKPPTEQTSNSGKFAAKAKPDLTVRGPGPGLKAKRITPEARAAALRRARLRKGSLERGDLWTPAKQRPSHMQAAVKGGPAAEDVERVTADVGGQVAASGPLPMGMPQVLGPDVDSSTRGIAEAGYRGGLPDGTRTAGVIRDFLDGLLFMSECYVCGLVDQ